MTMPFPPGLSDGDKSGEDKSRVRRYPTFYLPENSPHTCIQGHNWRLPVLSFREGNGNSLQYSCLEKSHGPGSLVSCSPWVAESDTTERLPFHFSLSCIGEGNGSPLQCSSLENPRDGGAWWAGVYGVTELDKTEMT